MNAGNKVIYGFYIPKMFNFNKSYIYKIVTHSER